MHPLVFAGLMTTAAGLLLTARDGKAKPEAKAEVLPAVEKPGTPAPVHPESTAAHEAVSTDSDGRIINPDPLGVDDSPAPESEPAAAE